MNKIITTSLIAVALVLSILAITKEQVQIVVPEGQSGIVGAVSGPDISSPYFSYGGVRHWGAKTESLTEATTTVCALQSPAATSTLSFGSIRLSVSSTTASTVTMAKATTPYATTSLLASSAVGANAFLTLVATSSLPVGFTTFAPNTYLVIGMADATPQAGAGTFSPTGVCQATWVEN